MKCRCYRHDRLVELGRFARLNYLVEPDLKRGRAAAGKRILSGY